MAGAMQQAARNVLALSAAGPVAEKYYRSEATLAGIMGPVGSAKTTESIKKVVQAVLRQSPGPDGVRRARVLVIRDTYPNLEKTVLASWFAWFPKSLGEWSGKAPFTHKLRMGVHRPGDIELEVIFMAIGDARVEDVLRGLEITAAWLNEADRLSPDVIRYLLGRIGRYPNATMGGCQWSGIFMDFNAPDMENYLYKLLVEQDEALGLGDGNVAFFRQPGGREAGAENLHNLPPLYYEKQLIGASQDYVRRMIDNQFGYSRNGLPVWPEFQDTVHMATTALEPVKGLPLRLSADAGLTPALLVGQVMPNGQKRLLDEIVVFVDDEHSRLDKVGPTAFGRMINTLIETRYPNNPVEIASADPASMAGIDGRGEELSWLATVARETKLQWRPSPPLDNSLTVRLEAVRGDLTRLLEGGQPALLISPRCKTLRRALNSGYVYRRTNMAGGDGRYNYEPVKNQYSHVADALQYFVCSAGEARRVTHGSVERQQIVTVDNDYDLFGG